MLQRVAQSHSDFPPVPHCTPLRCAHPAVRQTQARSQTTFIISAALAIRLREIIVVENSRRAFLPRVFPRNMISSSRERGKILFPPSTFSCSRYANTRAHDFFNLHQLVTFPIHTKTLWYTTRSRSLWRMVFLKFRKSLDEMTMGRRERRL